MSVGASSPGAGCSGAGVQFLQSLRVEFLYLQAFLFSWSGSRHVEYLLLLWVSACPLPLQVVPVILLVMGPNRRMCFGHMNSYQDFSN